MSLKNLLFILTLTFTQEHSAIAVFDCAFLLEHKEALTQLEVLLNETENTLESNADEGFMIELEKGSQVKKILSRLKEMGIAAKKENHAILFGTEGSHQINRIAHYLKKRGIKFYWELGHKHGNAALTVENTDEEGHPFLTRKMNDITVSTKTLKNLILLNKQTDPTVRHELVHVKTILNMAKKIEGYFYGYVEGHGRTAYDKFMSFDEITATLETLAGLDHQLKHFPKETNHESSYRVLGQYRRLHYQNSVVLELYKLLMDYGNQTNWSFPEIKRTSQGTSVDHIKLEDGRAFTVFLSLRKSLTPQELKAEIERRLDFHQKLLKEIQNVNEPKSQMIISDPFDANTFKTDEKQWLEAVEEIRKKIPTLRRSVESVWAIKN